MCSKSYTLVWALLIEKYEQVPNFYLLLGKVPTGTHFDDVGRSVPTGTCRYSANCHGIAVQVKSESIYRNGSSAMIMFLYGKEHNCTRSMQYEYIHSSSTDEIGTTEVFGSQDTIILHSSASHTFY